PRAERRLVREVQVSRRIPLASWKRRRSRLAVLSGRTSIGTGRAASSTASERPFDHMIFELPRVLFAYGPATSRLTGLMHRLATSGFQIVPLPQRLACCAEAIGTAVGKPIERSQILRVELHTVRDALLAVLVIDASAVPAIEQLAGDIGRVQHA